MGSVNLTRFVKDPFTEKAEFDWARFKKVVRIFTRMLDNVVDRSGLPLEAQREEIMRKRRHGMGFLGLGSTMAMMGLPYGEAGSLAFTEEVAQVMAVESWKMGLELSKEKGPAPVLDEDFEITPKMMRQRPEMARDGYSVGDVIKGRVLHARYSRYMQRIAEVEPKLVEELAEHGARFTHATSIAPTGTISLSIGNNASNGIEPSFMHHYTRNVIVPGKQSKESQDVYSFELLAYRYFVNPEAGPEELPATARSANDVSVSEHVQVQAAAQKWVDSSISKTVNVPTEIDFGDFENVYLEAFESGLKGCTTYRYNPKSAMGVLMDPKQLEKETFTFVQDNGEEVTLRGNEKVWHNGQEHTAANLFAAIEEGYYGML